MAEGTGPGKRIGRRLRDVREAGLWTRNELAAKSGVSASTIEDLEQGLSARPRRTTIGKLAKALDVPIETFLGMTAESPEVDDDPLGVATSSTPEMQAAADDALLYLLAVIEAKLAKPDGLSDRDELLFAQAAVGALGWDRVSQLPSDLTYRVMSVLEGMSERADGRVHFDQEVLNLQRASGLAGRVPGNTR